MKRSIGLVFSLLATLKWNLSAGQIQNDDFANDCGHDQFKVINPGSRYVYRASEEQKNYFAAKASCASYGGRLAQAENAEDFKEIMQYYKLSQEVIIPKSRLIWYKDAYIGLALKSDTGHLYWDDNPSQDWSLEDFGRAFAVDLAIDLNENDGCGRLRYAPKTAAGRNDAIILDDNYCSNTRNYICQRACNSKVNQSKEINGMWSEWTVDVSCVKKDSQTWIKTKERVCNNPMILHGGQDCVGPSQEEIKCPAVDGGWSEWSVASDEFCFKRDSKTWIKLRQRTCNNPRPIYGGEECSGASHQHIPCTPILGEWSAWAVGSCFASENKTLMKAKLRSCNNPMFGGQCNGPSEEYVQCTSDDKNLGIVGQTRPNHYILLLIFYYAYFIHLDQ